MKKVVFGYVTACGTCKMSEYMLDVVKETVDFEVEKINLNLNKPIIDHYQITSTPVFLFLDDGEEVDRFYAAKSVTHLYEKITTFLQT
jgi:thioredoxin-like negative regulator of GroEL